MITHIFSESSIAHIHPFSDYEECAKLTLPFLTSGAVAISGGSTYANLFKYWVHLLPSEAKVSFFPVDERIVPFNDPQSNWGTAFTLFLKPLNRESDKNNFAISVRQYNETLKKHFQNNNPVFDTVFLGVGEDGHTASLFPDGEYFSDQISTVLQTVSPKPPKRRITLTPKVLATAKRCITVITGKNKKNIAEQIFQNNKKLPIVKILSQRAVSDIYIERELID